MVRTRDHGLGIYMNSQLDTLGLTASCYGEQPQLSQWGTAIVKDPERMADLTSLDIKVIEYLLKKGYKKTEQTLRQESSHVDKDGRPIQDRVEDVGEGKYRRGFAVLHSWIEGNLDIYKVNESCQHYLILAYFLNSTNSGVCCGQYSSTRISTLFSTKLHQLRLKHSFTTSIHSFSKFTATS